MASTPTVEVASEDDLKQMLAFLKEDFDRSRADTGGSFYHNRNLIENDQRAGRMFVLRDSTARAIQGYAVGNLGDGSLEIVEVCHNLRRDGRGKLLVDRFAAEAAAAGAFGLRVLCEPKSSIPFWERLGFTTPLGSKPRQGESNVVLYRPFTGSTDLPADHKRVPVKIELIEDDTWGECTLPAFETEGVIDGTVCQLAQHFTVARANGLVIVSITVDGKVLHDGYASSDEADWLNVELNGDFIRVRELNLD